MSSLLRLVVLALYFVLGLSGCRGITCREYDQIETFLECIECDPSLLDSVLAIGEEAVPFFSETLRGLPAGRRENLVRRLEVQRGVVAAEGLDTTGFINRHLGNHIARTQTRSAAAFAGFGMWDTLRLALASAGDWGYRDDVVDDVQRLVLDESSPVPRHEDGGVRVNTRNLDTGDPVHDLRVGLRRCGSWPPLPTNGEPGACTEYATGPLMTQTGASGLATFNNLSEGVYEIRAHPDPSQGPNVTPPSALVAVVGSASLEDVNLSLGEFNVIRGQVRGTDGEPGDGTRVNVRSHPSNPPSAVLDTTLQVGADGRFQLDDVPEGIFLLRAEGGPGTRWRCGGPSDHLLDLVGPEAVGAGDILCWKIVDYSGTVRNTAGEGYDQAQVCLFPFLGSGSESPWYRVSTTPAGEFSFPLVSSGPARLRVSVDDSRARIVSGDSLSASVTFDVNIPSTPWVDRLPGYDFDRGMAIEGTPNNILVLSVGGRIRARVIREGDTSDPAIGVPVLLRRCAYSYGTAIEPSRAACHAYDSPSLWSDRLRVSNAAGEVVFPMLLEGVYELLLDPDGPFEDRTGPVLLRVQGSGPEVVFSSAVDPDRNLEVGPPT